MVVAILCTEYIKKPKLESTNFKEVFKMGIMISIVLACFMSFLIGIVVGYDSGK